MKKKIFITLTLIAVLVCLFAISVSAEVLSDFINVDITLVDGTQTEAYIKKGNVWNGYQGYDRVTLYADYTDTSQIIDYKTVKVFDGRKSEIHTYDGTTLTKTGTYPQTLLGYPVGAENITHVYYPQGTVIVADNSFNKSKGWDIEYLWIPSSVKILGKNICDGADNLTTVEFEKNSQLEEIQDGAFGSCTSLSSINLSDTVLKIIGTESGNTGAFRACESLVTIEFPQTLEFIGYNAFYLSGLSGRIVVPNNVTFVGPGAFLSTKIETLVLGDGPIKIGNNFVGDYNSTSNQYLKNIYIPAEATFINTTQTWFKCTNTVNFYVIGDNCQNIISLLTQATVGNYMTIIHSDDIDTYEGVYNGVIIEGYNKCDAFYNGEHDCNEKSELNFTNALTEFCEVSTCSVCNKKVVISDTYAPIFKFAGYSTKENGTALCVGYTVNDASLAVYNKYNASLQFGVVASIIEDGEGLDLLTVDNGSVVANSKYASVVAPISSEYAGFDFILGGFEEEHLSYNVVMCAYVYDGENISYLTSTSNSEPITVTVADVIEFEKNSQAENQ